MNSSTATLTETDRLRQLSRCLAAHKGFAQVVASLESRGIASIDGVWGSSCALVAAELLRQRRDDLDGPIVAVSGSSNAGDGFCDDLALFTELPITTFPARLAAEGNRLLQDENEGQRLRLLKGLMAGNCAPLVVASIQSLLQPVPPQSYLAANTRVLRQGERLDLEQLLSWLVDSGFHNTSAVELPCEFSIRGGILDIFAADWTLPVRIELFDDEISSLRRFEVATQRSIDILDKIDVTVLASDFVAQDHFFSFLPADTWFLLLDPESIQTEGSQYVERLERPQDQHSLPETFKRIAQFANVSASTLAQGTWKTQCRLPVESVERFSGDVQKVREELEQYHDREEVFVLCQTGGEVQRLREIFRDTQLASRGKLHFPVGHLQTGFRLTSERIVLVSGNELFHRTDIRRLPSRRLGKKIDNFLDLREGDLVVHLSHGIGRYRGLKLLEKEIAVEEHLAIEFQGGTKIYVPASKIGLVQKYIGSTKGRPRLARIGGKTWIRQKQAAELAAIDLASEMLQLQATRSSRPGISFTCDTQWQQEFDALFPYEETPDQWTAMQDIRTDMAQIRPMDRLLCGDVGFGKTELAIRAAFTAIDNGYQVAMLVPTTILAEQHYRTFQERMSEFPCRVARLSRFCSGTEQREVLAGLRAGKIDVVIGTHRLASKDVAFQNLGLVVIDEEQRFGVEVKERLKTLRTTVDVLTMTATPIPRTLHMSLVGVRDISNLTTAPEERVAVETRVTRFHDDTIRQAIIRELNRGGQIYFVHNRVNDIGILANRLQQMVPEARLQIGHGQMAEAGLEQVMMDFVDHRFDLLVATTIVESGLDIPNANTIFVDEADRYGLADLHQLRGRVGRYKHRAYCYLLIDAVKNVTPNAARRLRAIEEFSDMGSGFAIAMRDLEIRGAGNILGTQQSGHIAAVGYELYCDLLEQSVRKLQHKPPKAEIDVTLDLPGQAYLPSDYMPDMRSKIDFYRRFSRISSDVELEKLSEELQDRFGTLSPPVQRMFELQALRIDASVWQIDSIRHEDKYLVYTYTDRGRAEQLVATSKKNLRIVDSHSIYRTLSAEANTPDEILSECRSIFSLQTARSA